MSGEACQRIRVAALLALSMHGAFGAERTGHELKASCTDPRAPGACLNELILMADMHDVVATWGVGKVQWCMPEPLAPAALKASVLAYLADESVNLDQPSTRLIAAAYAKSFPCP